MTIQNLIKFTVLALLGLISLVGLSYAGVRGCPTCPELASKILPEGVRVSGEALPSPAKSASLRVNDGLSSCEYTIDPAKLSVAPALAWSVLVPYDKSACGSDLSSCEFWIDFGSGTEEFYGSCGNKEETKS